MNPDLLTSAERHLRHLCGAIEWSDEHYAKTGEHWTVETSEARAVADSLRAAAEPKPVVATMTHPDALARLHRIAGAHAGQSDPYIRAVLPPVPLEWETPAERQEWRGMVIALTDASSLPDVGIPAAVWQHARAVADTTL